MIRRCGNFGFVDDGAGRVASFNLNARGGRHPGSVMLAGGVAPADRYHVVGGVKIIPYGHDNNLPGYIESILDRFYMGEGIMGKKIGLQWGSGPELYLPVTDSGNGHPGRVWTPDSRIMSALESFDFRSQMHACLVDLAHLDGFWVKITRQRAQRVGMPGKLARVEHVPAGQVRFVYRSDDEPPTHAAVADFPFLYRPGLKVYPLFDPADPLRHAVSLGYYRLYSYNKQHYSTPRYLGAREWIELAGSLAGILTAYNDNASAISMHIESPQSYWDNAEQRLKDICERRGEAYSHEMLEKYKDDAMEAFFASTSGKQNSGKLLHTESVFNEMANTFEGWKVTPIDKKIKDYIDAQMAIARKSEAAATSGFGLDPALSNLILDTKLGSGSEKLYSLKVYNATETALPDMTLCAPFETFIKCNFPESPLRLGLYRPVVDAEQNVNPENRIKANI